MRTPRREQGRYASLSGLSIIRNAVDAPFPLIVIDRSGRPVPHLTEYYRLSLLDNVPRTTVDTYFGLLLPVFSYFLDHGWDWCRPPDDIRQYLTQFFRAQLHCKISSATVQGFPRRSCVFAILQGKLCFFISFSRIGKPWG